MNRFYSKVSWVGVLVVMGATAGLTVYAQAKPKKHTSKSNAKTAFKPVQHIHQMMEGQKKLFIEIKEGILDEQWKEAAKAAWILAEIANVNQYQHKNPRYKKYARTMSHDCVKLAKLLKKQDGQAAKAMVETVGHICSACHHKFRE